MTILAGERLLRPFAAGPTGAGDALALSRMVREAVAAGAMREALHLRLSGLAAGLRRGHHQRLLREALEPLLRPTRARVFELPNGDVIAVAPPEGRHLGAVADRLAVLFAAEQQLPFSRHRLPAEAAALLAAVEESLAPAAAEAAPAAATPLTTADLAAMEGALGHAGLLRFLLRRPVCRLAPGDAGPALEWEEWRPDWPALWAALRPGVEPALAPALFRRLRRLAERRLLAGLARPEEARRLGRAGLRLSLETLETAEFLRLDAALGPAGRARMVLGLEAGAMLADPAGFAFARDLCRIRGWRLALDVAAPALLPALDLPVLGVELVRLRWSPELPTAAAALPAERERLVLAGADRAAAIGWGWEAGITLFEGRLLRPQG